MVDTLAQDLVVTRGRTERQVLYEVEVQLEPVGVDEGGLFAKDLVNTVKRDGRTYGINGK